MAEIIDLDFYRKFRLILPIRARSAGKSSSSGISRTPTRRYRRRQKSDLKAKTTEKE